MAWRIDEHVIRGEIDNRTRGRVTGRLWFVGRDAPVELELTGNAWRDLAGRRLEFTNPEPKPGLADSFVTHQRGAVGDITASRKVKVPEIPLDQIGEYYAARKPFPWHWGNCLYLEWYSERNGRVVVESPTFQLTVSPDVTWDMTEDEELEQRRTNGEALTGFMDRLTEAVDRAHAAKDVAEEPDDTDEERDRPQTEEEAEQMLAESENLTDRIRARMDREGEGADLERILEEELERRRAERGDKPLTPEQEAARAEWIDAMNRAAEEAMDDPGLSETRHVEHPLATRAGALALRLIAEPEQRGWVDDDTQREHPVMELIHATTSASVKLAGALHDDTWPPEVASCGLIIGGLKRVRAYLDDARAAATACDEEELTEAEWLTGVRAELEAIAIEVDALIGELRARLARGFD